MVRSWLRAMIPVAPGAFCLALAANIHSRLAASPESPRGMVESLTSPVSFVPSLDTR